MLKFQLIPKWPALAWLAICQRDDERVRVLHGHQVETHTDWFCEAVWAGRYTEANFDRTDLFYGSGGRRRSTHLCFVSSGATTDRLHYLERVESALVSNSLACLLAYSQLDPDPHFRGYLDLFSSIARGINKCDRSVPLTNGVARLVYFNNLEWDGRALKIVPKPTPQRDFSTYGRYIAFLKSSLGKLAANLSCPDRAFSYTWQGSLSRGYDSPMSVALASQVGLRSVLSFNESRPGVRDDGRLIAEALGVDLTLLDRLDCHRLGVREALFLSADGQGKEMMLSAAAELLRRRVFITGFSGDYVWSKNPAPSTPDLPRGDYSGLSLCEYRLHAGFIHLPLPYMGMSQVADIGRISSAPEMLRWDVGGDYSRPISRRVLEERGVQRELFGQTKTGASIRFVIGQDPWSSAGHRAFNNWILTTPVIASGRIGRARLVLLLSLLRRQLVVQHTVANGLARWLAKVSRRIARHLRRCGAEDYAFLWGMEQVCRSYRNREGAPTQIRTENNHASD